MRRIPNTSIGPEAEQESNKVSISAESWARPVDLEIQVPVGSTVEQAEKSLILITLAHTKNNKTRAAEILGISLKTLFNKLKEYGSSEPEPAPS